MDTPSYQALREPLPIDTVSPSGGKRPIQSFPKVLGHEAIVRGFQAFHLSLVGFLGRRPGESPRQLDGSALHALLDAENEQEVADILRFVVREEIPRHFGKYLDALLAFNVSVHREHRALNVFVELKPHGAAPVSWSFELRFPPGPAARPWRLEPAQPPRSQAKDDPRAQELIRLARHHYPSGFPLDEEDDEEPVPAYQRTPEYQRWMDAWDKALHWKQWDALLDDLRAGFAGHTLGDATAPYMMACRRCGLYLREPLPDGGQILTRVAAAVSVLGPLYLVYVTTQTLRPDRSATPPRLTFEPMGAAKPYADKLAHLIKQRLGYRPFPLELADVPLPHLRVGSLTEEPTLLGALLHDLDGLSNLP